MSIENQYGSYELYCDICCDSIYADSFDEARQAKKENGWKSIKEDGEWNDICPKCQRNHYAN